MPQCGPGSVGQISVGQGLLDSAVQARVYWARHLFVQFIPRGMHVILHEEIFYNSNRQSDLGWSAPSYS